MNKLTTCSECGKSIKYKDQVVGFRAVCIDGRWRHRWCHFKTSDRYEATKHLFSLQDNHTTNPENAMADLIADLALFSRLRRVDFKVAVEKGMRYAEEET